MYKRMSKSELIEELISMGQDKEYLKGLDKDELRVLYEDITDLSDLLPNETYEEFMDHEDY